MQVVGEEGRCPDAVGEGRRTSWFMQVAGEGRMAVDGEESRRAAAERIGGEEGRMAADVL